MSDSFRQARGRKVVSRASAHELGVVDHMVVDAGEQRISAVVVRRGRSVHLVDWAQVSGFGPDAVMVSDDGSLRPPTDDGERAAAGGSLELVDARVLTERGNELGTVDDVTFDPGTGAVELLRIGEREIPAGSMLGIGPYAVIVDASQDPAP